MKRHPIVPFRDPLDLAGISLENAEAIIEQALMNCPRTQLIIKPQNIIDTKTMVRTVMRERQEVKIEEIGNEL